MLQMCKCTTIYSNFASYFRRQVHVVSISSFKKLNSWLLFLVVFYSILDLSTSKYRFFCSMFVAFVRAGTCPSISRTSYSTGRRTYSDISHRPLTECARDPCATKIPASISTTSDACAAHFNHTDIRKQTPQL